MVLKNTLLDYWRDLHKKKGYVEIATPIILSRHLWENSGHWDHYKDNMYTTVIDEEDFAEMFDIRGIRVFTRLALKAADGSTVILRSG